MRKSRLEYVQHVKRIERFQETDVNFCKHGTMFITLHLTKQGFKLAFKFMLTLFAIQDHTS